MKYRVFGRAFGLALGGASLFCVSPAHATTMRIVNWNIEADLNSDASGTFAGTGATGGGIAPITTVLQGIGSLNLNDGAGSSGHPIDVLALEEVGAGSVVTGNNSAVAPSTTQMTAIVNALNKLYPGTTYAYSTVANYTSGGEGGGPSTIVYNTNTISSVNATNIGTATGYNSSPGPYRAPMQYQIQPAGYGSAAQFYLDVSHMKSGSTATDASDRSSEATEIVGSTPVTSGAHVVAVGDFNITGGAAESTYQTMLTKFTDPNDTDKSWIDTNSKYYYLQSEHGYDVEYRDDLQFVSASAVSGSGSPGLQYDSGTETVFGNFGGTTIDGKNVNSQENVDTFSGLTTAQSNAVLTALGGDESGANDNDNTAASDHLPIVGDFDIVGVPTPEPTTAALLMLAMIPLHRRRRK